MAQQRPDSRPFWRPQAAHILVYQLQGGSRGAHTRGGHGEEMRLWASTGGTGCSSGAAYPLYRLFAALIAPCCDVIEAVCCARAIIRDNGLVPFVIFPVYPAACVWHHHLCIHCRRQQRQLQAGGGSNCQQRRCPVPGHGWKALQVLPAFGHITGDRGRDEARWAAQNASGHAHGAAGMQQVENAAKMQ